MSKAHIVDSYGKTICGAQVSSRELGIEKCQRCERVLHVRRRNFLLVERAGRAIRRAGGK